MDATVLLLLFCCWNLTEERGEVESEITEGALSKAMNFHIPTASEHNTLHPSFDETNTVTNSVMIQDVTAISIGTEAAQFVRSYEDGKAGLDTSKDTNTLKGFIQRERQTLNNLNNKIYRIYSEVDDSVSKLIDNRTECDRHLALNKITELEEALTEYVNRSREMNTNIDKQNSSAEEVIKLHVLGMVEGDMRAVLNTKYQLNHLLTLIDLNIKFNESMGILSESVEDKGDNYVSDLEVRVTDLREMIGLLNKHLCVAKQLLSFIKNFNLDLDYSDEYIKNLVNFELWETELQNRNEDLTYYEKLLKEERFKILLFKYIYPSAQSVIFITGVLGNGILLLVFAMHREIRTSPNLMVLNLALGDFLSLICNNLVFYVVEVAVGPWHHGLPLCKAYRFSRTLSMSIPVYSTVAISAQRFFVVTFFSKYHGSCCRLMKKYQSLLMIASVWLISTAVAVPDTVNAVIYENTCFSIYTEDSDGYARLFVSIHFISLCVLPLAFIAVLSGATARRIKESIKVMPGEIEGRRKFEQQRILSSNILITLVLVFAVCYVPFFLYELLNEWLALYEYVDNSTHLLISCFTYCLIFANSCFNPIAIYIASRKYRRYMRKYLLCRCRELANQKGKIISTTPSTTVVTSM